MTTRWTTRNYALAGLFAAIAFGLAFLLGAGVILATGIPATGGIANIFVAGFVVIVGMHLVPKFGFATLTCGLIFTYSIPTVIGGPPGAQKIINGVLVGLTMDLVVLVAGRMTRGYTLAGSFAAMVSIASIYGVMVLFDLPGADKLGPLVLPLVGMQAVLGGLAGWLGHRVYERRLRHLASVQRLSDQSPSPGP